MPIEVSYDCPHCGHRIFLSEAKPCCKVCEKQLVEKSRLINREWNFVCPVCKKGYSGHEDHIYWLATCRECGRIARHDFHDKVPASTVLPQTIKNVGHTSLSTQEIQYLAQRAESYAGSHTYERALECYDQLIQKSAPHPYHLKRRGFCHRLLGNLEKAIDDFTKAIQLDPDDGTTYWERGATRAQKLSLEMKIPRARKREMLAQILIDYKASVERIPTSEEGWLAILETDMLLHEWDDAISTYGACKPYIASQSYQLVRAWLGSLALTFAGDELDDECKKPLSDMITRMKNTEWCVSEVDSLFIELGNENFDALRLDKAKAIHQKFLDHFDEPPIRYHIGKG